LVPAGEEDTHGRPKQVTGQPPIYPSSLGFLEKDVTRPPKNVTPSLPAARGQAL
jgi:hypothetical protein